MKGKGVKMGKTGKRLLAFFWVLNRGLKLADETKFVLGENDVEYRANICLFPAFLAKMLEINIY